TPAEGAHPPERARRADPRSARRAGPRMGAGGAAVDLRRAPAVPRDGRSAEERRLARARRSPALEAGRAHRSVERCGPGILTSWALSLPRPTPRRTKVAPLVASP